jgi:hypothetical protein
VRHTHGAGAAFSGGLAHAYLTGATARQAVEAGYVAGTRPLRSYWPDTPPAHQRPCSGPGVEPQGEVCKVVPMAAAWSLTAPIC